LKAKDTFFHKRQTLNLKGDLMDLSTPKIMGILNATPDSFFDGGKYQQLDEAIIRIEKMIEEGVDILDIGAFSTRPGADIINEKEELKRLSSLLPGISKRFPNLPISIDTFRSEIAKATVAMGAHIINDVSGGNLDDKMFKTVGELKVPYVLMHMQGTPQTMQNKPTYEHVVAEILEDLGKKTYELVSYGVNDVIVDPGFGFGKTVEHNYQILNQLTDFKMIEMPILVGFSRKSMINKVLNTKPESALNGTTILNTMAIERGADILRVHDVKEAKQVITLHKQLHSS
jgi:dihydropteroate synthase